MPKSSSTLVVFTNNLKSKLTEKRQDNKAWGKIKGSTRL